MSSKKRTAEVVQKEIDINNKNIEQYTETIKQCKEKNKELAIELEAITQQDLLDMVISKADKNLSVVELSQLLKNGEIDIMFVENNNSNFDASNDFDTFSNE